MYPLKFKPILKQIIWGGDAICQFKNISDCESNIGESWEVSGVKGDISIVTNGDLQGNNLEELITTYKGKLVGEKVYQKYGTTFPLLIKFIDARDALSIQVHPNDDLAMKRHNSFGKTEMWYVINTAKDAFLYSGFSQAITPEEYIKSLEDDTFVNYLQRHDVKSGDVFFLPAGRVHAIGAGCFIAEIQQTSNITYRIYDYNRKDKNGNPRELHTELAKDAIDYKLYPDYKLQYTPEMEEVQHLVDCPYFSTNLINGEKGEIIQRTHQDTFSIFICMSGKGKLTNEQGDCVEFRQGESILVPAENKQITIQFDESGKILETFVPD